MKKITCQQIRDAFHRHNPEIDNIDKQKNIWLFEKHYLTLSKDEFFNQLDLVKFEGKEVKSQLNVSNSLAQGTALMFRLSGANLNYEHAFAFGEVVGHDLTTKAQRRMNFLVTDDETINYYNPHLRIFVKGEFFKLFFARI